MRLVTLIIVGEQKAYPNRIPWLGEPTPHNKTLPKHVVLWWTQENLENCKRSELKIWHFVKYSIRNLTRCKEHDSKSDNTKSFKCEIMPFTKTFSIGIQLFRKKVTFKKLLFRNFFSAKSFFLKSHVKRKIFAYYGVNWIKMWFFVCNFFFKKCLLKLFFSSKSCFLKIFFLQNHAFKKIFFLKIWRFVIF